MFVVPLGFCTRDQNNWRNCSPSEPVSVFTPNQLRSLLFGGIEPSTSVGTGSFSDVPSPKESSPPPLVLSSCFTPRVPVPTSQSIQFAASATRSAPLILSVSISNALLPTVDAGEQSTAAAFGAVRYRPDVAVNAATRT